MLLDSQPSPACPFHKSSTKIKLGVATGGMKANTEIFTKNTASVSLGLGSNQGLRGVMPATGRLSQGTLIE